MVKFIHFGCWNNLNNGEGNLLKVMRLLKAHLDKDKQIKFLTIAGDNYYPKKHKGGKVGEDAGVTRYTIDLDLFKKGFAELEQSTNNLPIYMILGNHDLVPTDLNTSTENPRYTITSKPTSEAPGRHVVNDECYITKKGIDFFEETIEEGHPGAEYKAFQSIRPDPKTLIIMIDTSIHTLDAREFLPCYEAFDTAAADVAPQQHAAAAGAAGAAAAAAAAGAAPAAAGAAPAPAAAGAAPAAGAAAAAAAAGAAAAAWAAVAHRKDKQKRLIHEKILDEKKKGGINYLILIGHHPITGRKKKKKKGMMQYTYLHDMVKSFDTVLETVFAVLPPPTKYYYLCADAHQYQSGVINHRVAATTATAAAATAAADAAAAAADVAAATTAAAAAWATWAADAATPAAAATAAADAAAAAAATAAAADATATAAAAADAGAADATATAAATAAAAAFAAAAASDAATPAGAGAAAAGTSFEEMTIHQYIVGTGGTKLDLCPSIDDWNVPGDPPYTYKPKECVERHGFLECTLGGDSGPVFNFVPEDDDDSEAAVTTTAATSSSVSTLGGGGKKKRSKKKNKKNKKNKSKKKKKRRKQNQSKKKKKKRKTKKRR